MTQNPQNGFSNYWLCRQVVLIDLKLISEVVDTLTGGDLIQKVLSMGNKIIPHNVVILPTPLNRTTEKVESPHKQGNDNHKVHDRADNQDKVSLSEEGKRMSKQLVKSTEEPLDRKRVAEIKQAVKNGTMQIDDDSIAERLLQIEGGLSPSNTEN